jgi:hypothetical protein
MENLIFDNFFSPAIAIVLATESKVILRNI